jgi:hypothetical protein
VSNPSYGSSWLSTGRGGNGSEPVVSDPEQSSESAGEQDEPAADERPGEREGEEQYTEREDE